MNVCFINLSVDAFQKKSYPRHSLPPMDIGYAAAVLEKEGFNTTFIDLEVEEKNAEEILSVLEKESIDFIVIKSDIQVISKSLDLIKKVKGKRKVIAIGPSLTLTPGSLIYKNSSVDMGIGFEPEYTLAKLLKRITKGKDYHNLKGIVYFKERIIINPKSSLIKDLDNLPFPKHDLFLNKQYSFFYPTGLKKRQKLGFILTSRGCPYSCSFCSPIKRNSYGKQYRQRSIKNIIDELLFLKEKGVSLVYFRDDMFNQNKQFVLKFSQEMLNKKVDLAWAAQCRADILDGEQAKKMKAAGCVCINTGIESSSNKTLTKIKKNTTIEKINKGILAAKKAGINVVGCFIIGIPGETTKDINASMNYAKNSGLDMLEALLFVDYPKENEKIEDVKRFTRDYEYSCPSNNCGFSVNELKKIHLNFHKNFYFRISYLIRYLYRNLFSLITNFRNTKELILRSMGFLSSQK